MMQVLKAAGVAAAILAVPAAASAATIRLTPAESGNTYDLISDDYGFAEVFAQGTSGQTLTYTFENTSNKLAALTIVGGNVLQVGAAFQGGAMFMVGDQTFSFAEGESDDFGTSLTVGAGQTVDVVLSFGNVVDNPSIKGKGSTTATFTVEAAVVPVPAAGLLLLTAVGGLAFARRRKSA